MIISIIGCGAIGSNLAVNLAWDLKGYEKIILNLVDFDKVENRNIRAGTQIYDYRSLNKPKTFALASMLSQIIDPNRITISNDKIVSNNLKKPGGVWHSELVLDCVDNSKTRNLLIGLPNPVFHIGFSPLMTGMGIWNPYFPKVTEEPTTQNDICEATGARSFIKLIVALGNRTILKYIDKQEKESWIFNGRTITYV